MCPGVGRAVRWLVLPWKTVAGVAPLQAQLQGWDRHSSSHKVLLMPATYPRAVPGHRELCLFHLLGHSSAVWPPSDHQTPGWAGTGYFS